MINDQLTKRQHYVPQLYLKKFSRKKDKVHIINVYDKVLNKFFTTDVKNVCCEVYFNDLLKKIPYSNYQYLHYLEELMLGRKPKIINSFKDYIELKNDEEPIYSASLESYFCIIEGEFSRVLNEEIITSEDLTQLSARSKLVSVIYILHQMRRTRKVRDQIKKFLEIYIPNTPDIIVRYVHNKVMVNISSSTGAFLNMGWTLCINNTNLPYWTSDNPVILKNIIDIDLFTELHFQKGFKIYFPLTPKLCMLIYDPSVDKYPSKVIDNDIQSVIEKNIYQINNATLHVFSHENIEKDLDKISKIL